MSRVAVLPLLVLALGNAAPSVEGLWRTDDGKGIVRIAPCGSKICGRIAQVLDSGPGVPKTDINNPNPRLRTQPILGLQTLSGFTHKGAVWQGGRAYDPKSGRTYHATLQVNPDGSLKLTGCILFICQSRRWTRAG
jgi:uncharacterized protein (DUF2147 family)